MHFATPEGVVTAAQLNTDDLTLRNMLKQKYVTFDSVETN